jgi:orotidine-5'-phosphate decarboxylase
MNGAVTAPTTGFTKVQPEAVANIADNKRHDTPVGARMAAQSVLFPAAMPRQGLTVHAVLATAMASPPSPRRGTCNNPPPLP